MRNIVDQESALLALFKYKFRVILPLLVVNNGVFLPFGGKSDVCFVVTYLETATVMALGGLAVLMSSDCGLEGGREVERHRVSWMQPKTYSITSRRVRIDEIPAIFITLYQFYLLVYDL